MNVTNPDRVIYENRRTTSAACTTNKCSHLTIHLYRVITFANTDIIDTFDINIHLTQSILERYIQDIAVESREMITSILSGIIVSHSILTENITQAIEIVLGDLASWYIRNKSTVHRLSKLPRTYYGVMLRRLIQIFHVLSGDAEVALSPQELSEDITYYDIRPMHLDDQFSLVTCAGTDHSLDYEMQPTYDEAFLWMGKTMRIMEGQLIRECGFSQNDLVMATETVSDEELNYGGLVTDHNPTGSIAPPDSAGMENHSNIDPVPLSHDLTQFSRPDFRLKMIGKHQVFKLTYHVNSFQNHYQQKWNQVFGKQLVRKASRWKPLGHERIIATSRTIRKRVRLRLVPG